MASRTEARRSPCTALPQRATTPTRNCCVGNKLIQAPDYNASLGIDWRFARTAAGDLRLMVDGNYYAKQYFDAFNTERIDGIYQDPHESGRRLTLHYGDLADGVGQSQVFEHFEYIGSKLDAGTDFTECRRFLENDDAAPFAREPQGDADETDDHHDGAVPRWSYMPPAAIASSDVRAAARHIMLIGFV